jgi:hypothetical protein
MMIKPPRTTAAKLVDAYLEGKDTAPILAEEHREAYLAVAKVHARAQLEMLRDHANIARRNWVYLNSLTPAMCEQVSRYMRKHNYANNDNDRREPRGRAGAGPVGAPPSRPRHGANRQRTADRAGQPHSSAQRVPRLQPRPEQPQPRPDTTLTQEEADVLTKAIEQYTQRLADMGTRLRALADADVTHIEAELAEIQAMDPNDGSWGSYAGSAAHAREHFLTRGHQLLRIAKRREVTA